MEDSIEDDPLNNCSNLHPSANHQGSFIGDDHIPWTPFTGMTHTTSNQECWEQFQQFPPASPERSNQDFFQSYANYIESLGKSASFLYEDGASVDHDFLAPSHPENSGHNTASREGFDMYNDAINHWQSDNDSENHFARDYKPFGTLDTLYQLPEVQKDSGSKPKTYSDVAKSLQNAKIQKDKEEAEDHTIRKGSESGDKLVKPVSKTSHTRLSDRQRTAPFDGNKGSVVLPDSKYGLDNFEDRADSSEEKTTNSENLSPDSSRNGSSGSISSSTSGVDVHLTKKTKTDSKLQEKHTCEQVPPKSERLFFDPKRIFQKTEKDSPIKVKCTDAKQTRSTQTCSTKPLSPMLNNGKPPAVSKSQSVPPKKADYINNDLRDPKKRTNQTAALNRESRTKSHPQTENLSSSRTSTSAGRSRKHPRQDTLESDKHLVFGHNIDWEKIDEWVSFLWVHLKSGFYRVLSCLLTLLLYVAAIIMFLVSAGVHLTSAGCSKAWQFLKLRVLKNCFTAGVRNGSTDKSRRTGLDENIALPATGEEAMKRLLACRGKDPYSILGLKSKSSDDDIKKYYRRQAVLVHPDKNQEPGAEEAFKILGHAFEMIREPTKRQLYDAQMNEAHEAETAMHEFNDLLTKLHEKIQEAANMMRCDSCQGKHKRIPVDRPWYSARFCDKCNIRHPAKEGDIWAETKMLGFLWHYYACMEQRVYDITEWVACHGTFQQIQANAHNIIFRISTDGNRGHRQRKSGEPDLQEFINDLLNKANAASPEGASSWQQPASPPQASTSTSAKRGRRKKKHR